MALTEEDIDEAARSFASQCVSIPFLKGTVMQWAACQPDDIPRLASRVRALLRHRLGEAYKDLLVASWGPPRHKDHGMVAVILGAGNRAAVEKLGFEEVPALLIVGQRDGQLSA